MNIRTRFLTFLAAAAAVFTGCRQEEVDLDLPSIKIEGSGVTVDSETKKASFSADKDLTAITLSVTATRDWKAEIEWDADEVPWINVSPEEGFGTGRPQDVKVTILDNAGFNRAKQIKFNINYDYKTLYITQSGEQGEEIVGTLDNPFTVAGVNKYVKALGSDVQSPEPVYVKGIISQIADAGTYTEGGTFGNATFYISDDGSQTNEFYCYRILYLGNQKFKSGQTDIKVGDEVIVCGKVVNYKGNTPETVQGSAFLYELNGVSDGGEPTPSGDPKGTGTLDDPYNPAGAANAVKDLTWTSNDDYQTTGDVYIKGKISRIADKGTFTEGGTYGNASFYISEDGTAAGEFYCFRILYLGNQKFKSGQTDIKVGDEVIVCGQLMNYRGNTPETVAGKAYLYSLNGDTGGGVTPPGPGGDPAGTGTLADPYNVAAARDAVKDFTWTSNDTYDKTGTVYVKGKISKIADNGTFGQSGTYGNASFYISDDGSQGNELYCYRILYLGNEKYTAGTDIKVGDEVVICGQLMNYRGNTPETVANNAYLYSLNGNTGGDTPPGPGGDTSGSGTLSDPYNPLGAIDAVKDLTWTSSSEYESTGDVYVKGKISRIASGGTFTEGGTYGNASFYISEDGTENDEFYCFRILYLGNKKFESGQTDIKVGDEVIVYGQLMNYRRNTPETVSGKAYLYSLNGNTGGDTPPGPSDEIKVMSIASYLAEPVSTTQWYELTGTVSNIVNTTYGNFDLTDATGKVYVYGLCDEKVEKNNKTFASLDIKEGDNITIITLRSEFNGNPQAGGNTPAYLKSKNSGGGDTPSGGGTLDNPYTVAQALDAVKDLTWTSNSEYESTDEVYVKGKISRIASGGTFTEGGTYGNASFYISDDGSETNEFYCFRILYLGNKKFESGQTDIKVGDEVVVCGKLMNYKGNTPETVSGKAYLYSLNGSTTPGGGGDTPSGGTVSFATNSGAQNWSAATDGTYGAGFSTTTQDVKIGYYKHTSTSNAVAPNDSHVRVYKNSVLVVNAPDGKKIKKMVIGCAPNAGSSSYCNDMAGLEGGSSASADPSSLTVTWNGSASKIVLQANNGQIRMEKLTLEFE